GVVVNEEADARLSEAVAQAMLHGTADFGGNSTMRGLQNMVSDFVTRVFQLASDLSQLAITLVSGGPDVTETAGDAPRTYEILDESARPEPSRGAGQR